MIKSYMKVILSSLVLATSIASAQTSGLNDGREDLCSLKHGDWISHAKAHWACCWQGWGCYDCLNNICKMKCTSPGCTKANRAGHQVEKNELALVDLAPKNMLAPVIPRPPKKNKLPLLPEL